MYLVGLVYTFGKEEKPAPRAEAAYVAPVAVAEPEPAPEPVLVVVPVVLTQQYCSILDIQFEINANTVQRESEEKIDKVGLFMKKYPRTTAVIEGHTDEVGTAAENMKLSERRAEGVVTYLADHGIARSRMKSVGYGETRPIGDNRTQVGKRLNRRINAIIACATDIEGILPIPERVTMAMELEFDRNNAAVRPQYREELRKVANFMKANPKVTATVEGHTGNLQATKALAMEISQRRAQNVVNYLVTEFTVARSRLTAEGFGQTRRFAYNTSIEGRQENRRVNIILDFPDQK
jgi:OOP family OmpA-OmpF porin